MRISETFIVALPNMKGLDYGVGFRYSPIVFVPPTVFDLLKTEKEKMLKSLRIYLFDTGPEGIKKLREKINASVVPVPTESR